MQKPVSNVLVSSPDNSTVINETVPPPLTSIEQNQGKQSIGKTGKKNRVRFPLKFRRSKHQPNTMQEGFERFRNSYSEPQQHITPSKPVKTKHSHFNKSSVGEKKLNEIVEDLNENPVEGEDALEEQETPSAGCRKSISRSRRFIVNLMEQPNFHYAIIVLIIIDLIIVFIELILSQLSLPCLTEDEMIEYNTTNQRYECLLPSTNSSEMGESALYYISLIIVSVFVIEVLTAFYAFGWRRYTKILFLVDAIIVLVSFVLEVCFHFGSVGQVGRAAAGIVILRLWKIIRAIHAIAHSISLRNHMIVTHIKDAQQILYDEKIEAENRIQKQQIEIDFLKNLVENNAKEINRSTRSKVKNLDTISLC